MMIFATVLIPMAIVFQYIAISTAKTRTKLMGQYLARGLVEKCMAAKFYNVKELATSVNYAPTGLTYDPIEMTLIKDGTPITYTYFQEVQVTDGTDDWASGTLSGLVVRAKVSWEDKNRSDAATRPYVEYISYIGENS